MLKFQHSYKLYCEVNGVQIFLKNESDKRIIIELDKISYTVAPNAGVYVRLEKESAELSVCADAEYRSDPVTGKLGLSYFHRFVVNSTYTATPKGDCTIRFYAETAHGNNFESYTRIYPFSDLCEFSAPFYTVKGERKIKEKIARSDKNETVILQGAGIAGKLFKAKNTFDDIVAGLIVGLIALVAFVLIWIFKDFRTAASIYGMIAVIGFLLWKLILERALKKAKAKAKKKAENKIEKMFLPCEDMPEGIFKGKGSYFDHEYINAVFRHSSKRI